MNRNSSIKSTCGDYYGSLPSCGGLAFPYIPMQETGSSRFDPDDALRSGTLYPGLDLPFRAQSEAKAVQRGPLTEVQALDFVVHELGLYLDTHPDDQEAFTLFQQYTAMAKEAQARSVSKNGPLQQTDAAADSRYTWLDSPWPWDNAVNKED